MLGRQIWSLYFVAIPAFLSIVLRSFPTFVFLVCAVYSVNSLIETPLSCGYNKVSSQNNQ